MIMASLTTTPLRRCCGSSTSSFFISSCLQPPPLVVSSLPCIIRNSSSFFHQKLHYCISSRSSHSLAVNQLIVDQISKADLFTSKQTNSRTEELSKTPSVTKILKATQSVQTKRALERWRLNMLAKMDVAAFEKYSQGLLSRGHAIHSAIHHHLLDEDMGVDEEAVPFFTSVRAELSKFDNIQGCEMYLSHDFLPYCGVVDCIAHYNRSGLYVIDWKTSNTKKTSLSQTFDHPVQLAAYVGLWNSNNTYQQVSQAMLVMMYPDGSPCDIIKVNEKPLTMYWQQWKSRLQQYWQQELDDKICY